MDAARHPSAPTDLLDHLLGAADRSLRALLAPAQAGRPVPGPAPGELDEAGRREAAGLMRVNHAGEIAAQGLYHGQALAARDPQLRADAACGRPRGDRSPGLVRDAAGGTGRPAQPAESPVVRRLVCHRAAGRLRWATARAWASSPRPSGRSRAISTDIWNGCRPGMSAAARSSSQMRDDEVQHGQQAQRPPAASSCPVPVRELMRATARVMTRHCAMDLDDLLTHRGCQRSDLM